MTSRDFAYWLQGFFELSGQHLTTINTYQLDLIKKHLNMVFIHEIDPSMGDEEHQGKLSAVHSGEMELLDLRPDYLKSKLPTTAKQLAIARC